MEASLRAAREHRARVRPARDRPRARAAPGLKGVAPSNIFKSRDDMWMVIAANQDNVFRRLCEAMGQPELADDPRFATHLARGENQEEIEGIVAEWAAAARRRRDRPRSSTRPASICGPIYTIADIFEDPQFKAREMLARARRPRVRRVHRPGDRPEVLRDARRGALVGARGRRAATTRRSTAGCSASPTTELAALKRGGRHMSRVTICDVGAARRAPERAGDARARRCAPSSSTGSPAAGLPRIEAVSFVNPARVPQMAGAEEVVAAIERATGVVYAGLALNERGYDRLRDDRARRGALRLRGDRDVQPAQPERAGRGVGRGARADRRARARGRHPRDGDDRRRVRLPVRGRRRPGPRARARRAARRAPARTRSSSPTRRRRRAAPGRATSSATASRSASRSASTSTTRATPASRTRTRRSRPARPCSTPRSAGSAAARSRLGRPATSHRGSRLPAPRRGRRDGHRPRRADRASPSGSRASSGGSSRVRSTGPARSRRSPARREGGDGMAYRLGVDVGGTFTDLFLVCDGRRRRAVPRQDAVDARRSVRGRAHRRPPDLRRGRASTSASCRTSSTARPSRRTRCSSRRARASA